MSDRLTRQNWIDAGLRRLAVDGAGALRVGTLAAALGVSRGSFYWHFRDFGDYRSQLLATWRERTVERIAIEFEADPVPAGRLRRLVKRAFSGKRGLDRAIRVWATNEPIVAAFVAEVDASRVDYMAKLLVAVGVDEEDARPRAAFVYCAYLGQGMVMDLESATIDEAALDAIADLLER